MTDTRHGLDELERLAREIQHEAMPAWNSPTLRRDIRDAIPDAIAEITALRATVGETRGFLARIKDATGKPAVHASALGYALVLSDVARLADDALALTKDDDPSTRLVPAPQPESSDEGQR